jgi:hypothetical protein
LKNILVGAELGMQTVFISGMTAEEEGFDSDSEKLVQVVISTLSDGGVELRSKMPNLFTSR